MRCATLVGYRNGRPIEARVAGLLKVGLLVVLASAGCEPTRSSGSGATGGSTGSGGQSESGGSGGSSDGSGGTTSSGGAVGQGGSGVTGSGGSTASGGNGGTTTASGGSNGTGGATGGTGGSASGTGGSKASGGTTGTGGGTGAAGSGGSLGSGGATDKGGSTGSGGTGVAGNTGASGPCDIYQSANTPCVAAHSTVRALYRTYGGALYQVRRASDKTTKDVPVQSAGGFVDISVQDSFCANTTCTISILYDQSANHNDLTKSPTALWLPNGGNEANASDGKITVSGHVAHGIYVNNPSANVGYRNNATKGLATGDAPEAMYMVIDGTRYSTICCFDYGNVETDGKDDGNATMEAMYWGASTQWTRGGGNGPWIAADLENGMFEGNSTNTPSNTSISFSYVTGMLKGPSGNMMGLKAGNAQSGALQTKWSGARPPGYSPMKKQGAIVLGTGGDGSNYGAGTFFEGAITSGSPPDATDDAVQANIVAAGYGK